MRAIALIPVLMLALAAGAMLPRELAAERFLRLSPAEQFIRLAGQATPRPLSLRAADGVLLACADALRGLHLQMAPASVGVKVAATCLHLARGADRGLPLLVAAQAHAVLGQPEAAARALAASQSAAPREGWLALRRFDLAAGGGVSGAEDVLRHDSAVILPLRSALPVVAAHYAAVDALRPVIRASVETLAAPDQDAFLVALRARASDAAR